MRNNIKYMSKIYKMYALIPGRYKFPALVVQTLGDAELQSRKYSVKVKIVPCEVRLLTPKK